MSRTFARLPTEGDAGHARMSPAAMSTTFVLLVSAAAFAQTPTQPQAVVATSQASAMAREDGDASLRRLIRDLAHDFRALPLRETGIWLGAGLVVTIAVSPTRCLERQLGSPGAFRPSHAEHAGRVLTPRVTRPDV